MTESAHNRHADQPREKGDRDRLAWRLADILTRLINDGTPLDPDELAADYNVHRRTILRDIEERFAFLPIEKKSGRYTLESRYFGCLNFKDIERFAALAGLQGLFPALDRKFLGELFDSRLADTLDVHGPNHEDLRTRMDDFRAIQRAITEHRRLRFHYTKPEGTKPVEAAPYRLINNGGVWYLAAVHDGKPKSYAFSKLKAPQVQETLYTPDAAIARMLDEEDSIWLNVKKTEVILTVAAPAAAYFQRRKLISKQQIVKELEDGSLIVSGEFAHPNQVLPIVRYWLPSVRIVSPVEWQQELESGLKEYIAPKFFRVVA